MRQRGPQAWRDRHADLRARVGAAPGPPDSEELADAWGTEIRWCIERFGVERCMFESNFPVDKQSCSYLVLWNAFKRMVAGASADDKAALFHDNAMRIYRINPVG